MGKNKTSLDVLNQLEWKPIIIKGKTTEYSIDENGNVFSGKSNKLLSPAVNSSGYLQVMIATEDAHYQIAIHRLVAIAFIPNPDPKNKLEVNHIDGNKLNNKVSNLEWVTKQENIAHAVRTGLRDGFRGEGSPKNVYPETTIRNICQLLEDGFSQSYISDLLNVNKGVVNSIKQKKMWKHISCEYNIPEPIHRVKRPEGSREMVINYLNQGVTDIHEILKLMNLDDTKLNRTYVAVIKCEIRSKT